MSNGSNTFAAPIPVQNMTFTTGTWTYTAPTASALGFQGKAAAAETSTITIPFGLPREYDQYGVKLNSLVIPMQVRTADLSGAITGTLYQYNTYRAPVIPAQTFTANADTDLITLATSTLTPGTAVQVSTSSALPGGLAASTTYFLGNFQGTSNLQCQLFTTLANALSQTNPINITSAGTGTQTVTVNDVDVTTIATTLTGAQVTNSNNVRRLVFSVTSPAFDNVATNNSLIDIVSYAAILSVPAATTTVVRVHDAHALFERTM